MSRPSLGAAASGTAMVSLEDKPKTLAIQHICFLPIQNGTDELLWPALKFDNFGALRTFLKRRGLLDPTLDASLGNQYLARAMSAMRISVATDPVALLLGGFDNPAGKMCIFCPTKQFDWTTHLPEFVMKESNEQKEALKMVQDIFSTDDMCKAAAASKPQESETRNETLAIESGDGKEVANEEEEEELPQKPPAKRKRGESEQPKTSDTAPETVAAASKEAPTADDSDESIMTSSEQEDIPEKHPEAKRSRSTTATALTKASSKKPPAVVEDSESVDSTTASEQEDTPEQVPVRKSQRPKKGARQSKASTKKAPQVDESESVDETLSTMDSDQSMTSSEQEESPPPEEPKRKRRPSQKTTEAKGKGQKKLKKKKETFKATKTVPNKRKKPEPPVAVRKSAKAGKKKSTVEAGPKKKKARKEEEIAEPVVETQELSTPKARSNESQSEAESSPDISVVSVANIMPATMPDFGQEVLPLLKKVNLKYSNGKFFLPGVDPSDDNLVIDKDYFMNTTRLRQHLCAYGIECKGFELKQKEETILLLWISTAIVPGLWGLKGEIKQELRAFLTPGRVHSMLLSLGFVYKDAYYFLPGEKPNVIGGICINGRKMIRDEVRGDDGLLLYLARFGLPRNCTFGNLTDEERLHLEYHISQYAKVDSLEKFEPEESDPPLFSDESDSNEVGENSGREGATASQEQTQNVSPSSCRGSLAGATQVTDSTDDGERDQQDNVFAMDESKDSEFRPEDACEPASSKEAILPQTQPEYDSDEFSSGRELFGEDSTSQNQLSMDTKSTGHCVEEICGGAAGEEGTSPAIPTKLFSETPGIDKRPSPTDGDTREELSNNKETDPASSAPSDAVFQEQVNDMLATSNNQGAPGGDAAFLKQLHAENAPRPRRTSRLEKSPVPSVLATASKSKKDAPRKQAAAAGPKPAAKKVTTSSTKSGHQKTDHPDLKKTVGQKLKACQNALGSSFNVLRSLSATDSKDPTLFQKNVDIIRTFLREAIDSDGAHGQEEGDPACLYVCGSPGVGKTSSIKWAIKEAERYASEQQDLDNLLVPSFCFLNAADVGSPKNVTDMMANALSLSKKRTSLENVKKALGPSQNGKGAPKCSCLIMVIDEIELLLSDKNSTSDKPMSSGEAVLKMLGDWSAAHDFHFALVGISNSIGNEHAKRLQRFGLAQNTVTFSPYRKEDLIKIVEDRVGKTIIDPKALEFAASKVSASSGDARKVLELTSNAVAKCMASLSADERKKRKLDKPIVTMKFMLKASKETMTKYADTIEGLPNLAKIILCVAVSLNQVEQVSSDMTMGMLKNYVFESLSGDNMFDDDMDIDTFNGLVQQLFDAGLLLSGTAEPFDISSQYNFTNLYSMPIRLGVHLHDVESALEETLGEQERYRRIMDRAKRTKRG